jgi:hypothetical protein
MEEDQRIAELRWGFDRSFDTKTILKPGDLSGFKF